MIKMHVLGPGCPKCKKLAENAEEAARQLGISRRNLYRRLGEYGALNGQ